MPREYPRKLRVAVELQRALNDLLLSDIKDPRLKGVSISAVEVSRDVSVAKVYFSTLLPDSDPEPAMVALDKARGFLRSRIGKLLHMRHAPELRFSPDEAAKRGFEISQLIDSTRSSYNSHAEKSCEQVVTSTQKTLK
jgi:ribosome-binding factor A